MMALGACGHEEFDIQNLNGGQIISMGHGGMGIHSTYPLDSPASVLCCLHSGTDGSEMDVQLTRDSVLVAYHSADLAEGTDMSGPVWEHTWSEVSQARFQSVPYTDHHIMSIEDLFDHIDLGAHAISFDIKLHAGSTPDAQYFATYINAICRFLDAHPAGEHLFFESQSPEFLALLKARRPDLRSFIYPPTFEDGLRIAREQGLFGISIDMHKTDATRIAEAHREGLWIILWNAESTSDNKEAIRMNPEVIQTDRPENLVGLLD